MRSLNFNNLELQLPAPVSLRYNFISRMYDRFQVYFSANSQMFAHIHMLGQGKYSVYNLCVILHKNTLFIIPQHYWRNGEYVYGKCTRSKARLLFYNYHFKFNHRNGNGRRPM